MVPQSKKLYGFVAYVDESGDDGLKRVRPLHPNGSSEWFVISAVVVQASNETAIGRWQKEMLAALRLTQRNDIHYRDLSPPKRELVCRHLATHPVRLFVVMSQKLNMVGHHNPRCYPERFHFYWWLTRLLFERVTAFCMAKSMTLFGEHRPIKIVFSRRGSMDYERLGSYWGLLRSQAAPYLKDGNLRWEVVDLKQIHAVDHKSEAGLQFADIVAGAFYQAVTIEGARLCDHRYAYLLAPRMYRGPKGRVLGLGIKYMPNLRKMKLREEQKALFRSYGATAEWW